MLHVALGSWEDMETMKDAATARAYQSSVSRLPCSGTPDFGCCSEHRWASFVFPCFPSTKKHEIAATTPGLKSCRLLRSRVFGIIFWLSRHVVAKSKLNWAGCWRALCHWWDFSLMELQIGMELRLTWPKVFTNLVAYNTNIWCFLHFCAKPWRLRNLQEHRKNQCFCKYKTGITVAQNSQAQSSSRHAENMSQNNKNENSQNSKPTGFGFSFLLPIPPGWTGLPCLKTPVFFEVYRCHIRSQNWWFLQKMNPPRKPELELT